MKPTISIICPLYNAEDYILKFHESLLKQKNVNILEYKYIMTESNDNTEALLKTNNIPYEKIKKKEFSHSLTREKAAMSAKGNILVFLTQDVEIRDDNFLEKLIAPIINNEASASYARQIAKHNNIEKYTREYNYPTKSHIVSKKDIPKLGLKTFFFSDAASAINTKVFKDLKGYDGKDLPTNEDMYFAYKLIINGYKIKYCAVAKCYHSHNFTLRQLYNRYKLIGQFMNQNPKIAKHGTTRAGGNLAKYTLKKALININIKVLFTYPFNMVVRYLGMRAGK